MSNILYLIQVLLYLLAICSIPVALSKRKLSRRVRIITALCPIILGLPFYLFTRQTSGIFVTLMGVCTLLFVWFHPQQSETEEEEKAQ